VTSDAGPPLGGAADEAVRLMAALQEWARRTGASSELPLATGSAECRLCPVCQAIALVKDASPEVVEHLSRAADSLLAAFRAAVVAHEASWTHGPTPDVQHIDIG
jgi:hypothetical protein